MGTLGRLLDPARFVIGMSWARAGARYGSARAEGDTCTQSVSCGGPPSCLDRSFCQRTWPWDMGRRPSWRSSRTTSMFPKTPPPYAHCCHSLPVIGALSVSVCCLQAAVHLTLPAVTRLPLPMTSSSIVSTILTDAGPPEAHGLHANVRAGPGLAPMSWL